MRKISARQFCLAIGIFTAFPAAPARAQETRDTTVLDPITVTGTRVPIAKRALASTVDVISGDELRAQGIVTVADALRSVAGTTVLQSGSFGSATSLFVRGGESDYVKVLVDGVAMNQPGGAYDFAHLSTTNIDRIEILRGPGSVLYGSDAVAGVVQIFTRTGQGAPRLSGGVRAGTYDSFQVDGALVGGTEQVQYSVALQRSMTGGAYAFNNDYDNTVASGRVFFRPDDRTDLSVSLRYRDSRFHFPTDGAGNVGDRNSFNLDEATSLSVSGGRFITDRIEARVLLSSNVIDGGIDDAQDDPADTLGFYAFRSIQDLSRQSADVHANVHVTDEAVITGGVAFEQQDERTFNESNSQFGPSNSSSSEERTNYGVYVQSLAEIGDASVMAGARIDDNEEFGTFLTYRVGGAYRFDSGTTLRASAGTSFKAPTFFENFAMGFAVGNPDLDPERAVAVEAALEQSVARDAVRLSAVFFYQRFRDLIQFTFEQTPNFANVAEAEASGVELSATFSPALVMRVSGNVTLLHTEVIDAGFDTGDAAPFVNGERLLRRPATSFNVSAEYRGWEQGGIDARLNYVGSRDDRDFNTFPATPIELPSFVTVDVSGRIHILETGQGVPGVTGTLRIENLFDETYQTVQGFPARGRTVMVGVRLH